jgi:hypothetical protein
MQRTWPLPQSRRASLCRRRRVPDGGQRHGGPRAVDLGDDPSRLRRPWLRRFQTPSDSQTRLERFVLGWGRSEGRAPVAISCRKSEIKLSLLHEQSIPSASRVVGPPFPRRFRDDKSARKKRPLKISYNPLISQDSDERIQGNPSFYNPQNLGFSQRKGDVPRKPKPGRRMASCPPSRGAKATSSKCTAV